MFKHLTVLAIVLLPFATSFHLDSENDENILVSLNQFDVYNQLGTGMFSEVYLARKNVGSDNGQLYALKVINITRALELEKKFERDSLNIERRILEAASEWSWATGLCYAWREGRNSFLVMNFVPGGSLTSTLIKNQPDTNTAQIILAEVVSIVERLHANGVLHLDCHSDNFLIQSDGFLAIADFGMAKVLVHNNQTAEDWRFLGGIIRQVLTYPFVNDYELSCETLLRNMTDADLPELKNHAYFNGIDWEKVAARESEPPFEPTEFKLDEEKRIDLAAKLKGTIDDELDEAILERLRDYAFVAPGLQH